MGIEFSLFKIIFMSRIVFILSLIVFMACSHKNEDSFTLQGSFANPTSDYIILLQESDIERKVSAFIDTIYLDTEGKFNASFNLEPHLYTLVIDNNKIPLAINKGQHIIIDSAKITGSKDTELLMAYEKMRKISLDHLVNSVRKEIKKEATAESPNAFKIDSLNKLEVANYDIHLEELNTFIKKNMDNSIALYATSIRWKDEKNISFFDDLVSNFEKQYPNLGIAKKLREKVNRLQQTSVGGIAPEIKMNTIEGNTISLSSINQKYTLIDFWASWCGPCRRESELLNNLYTKYHDKGLEIYGISLDTKKKIWLNAIEKDERVWTNVSSLEGFKTQAAYDFTVTALPVNYLIDNTGKIIAKNVHGDTLKQVIEHTFK